MTVGSNSAVATATDLLVEIDLGPGVGAWFTGRAAGNLSHRRPHAPTQLSRARQRLAQRLGVEVGDIHLMRQVHGARVGVVDAQTRRGAELRGVDALVTAEPGRVLAVQVADCVPLLLASDAGPVAAVHAGRQGLVEGVVREALDALTSLGAPPPSLRAAIGPAIGGCCYEVPETLQAEVVADHPAARATTDWGTPSLDLPEAVVTQLRQAGVAHLAPSIGCTHCDPEQRWFSHRRDPDAGRQLGLVVSWGAGR